MILRPGNNLRLRGRSTTLLRLAVLLAGNDRAAGEDLLQDVLTRMFLRWRRISGSPEAYARRALVNAATNRWRGRKRRPEAALTGEVHDTAAVPADHAGAVELRDALVRALRTLPPRQRAAVVLRYFADLSETDTAAALGCSTGTVKSLTHHGLARLRAAAGRHELFPSRHGGER